MALEGRAPAHGLEKDRRSPKINCGFQWPYRDAERLDEAVNVRRVQIGQRISRADFFREAVALHIEKTLKDS